MKTRWLFLAFHSWLTALNVTSGINVTDTIADWGKQSEEMGLLYLYPKLCLPACCTLLLIWSRKMIDEYCRLPFPPGDQPTLKTDVDSCG